MDIVQVLCIVAGILVIMLGLQHTIAGGVFLNSRELEKALQPVTKNVTVDNSVIFDQSNTLGIFYVVVGILNLLAGLYGICGEICIRLKRKQNMPVRVIFCIIMLVTVIVQCVANGLCFTFISQIGSDEVRSSMMNSLIHNYKSTTFNDDAVSTAFNYMFSMYHCCGVNSVTSTSTGFENTVWCNSHGTDCQTGTSKIPQSCCVGITSDDIQSASTICTANLEPETFYQKGCFDVYTSSVKHRCLSMAVPGIIMLIPQVTMLICELMLLIRLRKK